MSDNSSSQKNVQNELDDLKALEEELDNIASHCPRCGELLVDNYTRCPKCGWESSIPLDELNLKINKLAEEMGISKVEAEKLLKQTTKKEKKVISNPKKKGKIIVPPKNLIEYRCEKCGSVVSKEDKICPVCHTVFSDTP